MAPRTCFAVTLRGMKPNNGCFVVGLAIVFRTELRVELRKLIATLIGVATSRTPPQYSFSFLPASQSFYSFIIS